MEFEKPVFMLPSKDLPAFDKNFNKVFGIWFTNK